MVKRTDIINNMSQHETLPRASFSIMRGIASGVDVNNLSVIRAIASLITPPSRIWQTLSISSEEGNGLSSFQQLG